MLGKTHLILAFLFFAPLAYAFGEQGIIPVSTAILLVFGVLLGILIPDSDAVESRALHGHKPGLLGAYAKVPMQAIDTPIRIVGLVSRYLFYEPIALLVGVIGHSDSVRHRGFLHSIAGVALVSAFWALVFQALNYFNFLSLEFTAVVLEGMVAGALLHLYHDSLTPSGINWLYPYEGVLRGRIKGSYRGLGKKAKLLESQFFAIGLFVLLFAAVTYLAVVAKANAFFLAFLSGFSLLLIAFACGLEHPEKKGLVTWEKEFDF